MNATMRALVYFGVPYQINVTDQPKPQLQGASDAIVRVTTAAICGSDLHYYRGTYGHSEPPWYMGHEAVGYVQQIGEDVVNVNIDDRVVIPDITAAHQSSSIGSAMGPAFGVGGPDLRGCQAEYVRVPEADRSLFVIPNTTASSNTTTNATTDMTDLDWVMLSDVFSTGWAGLDFSGFYPGDTVAIFGAGPVGLSSAYSAKLRGASKIYIVDYVQSRLDLAASIGDIVTPINFRDADPVEQILALEPDGVVRTVDCVGYEALNADLQHQEDIIINQMIRLTMRGGGMGGIGVWGDAHQNNTMTAAGALASPDITVDMGSFWGKALSLTSGGVNVLDFTAHLGELIADGGVHPGFVFTDVVGIEDAPDAYARFERHETEKVAIRFPWRD